MQHAGVAKRCPVQNYFTLWIGLAGGVTRYRSEARESDYAALIRPALDLLETGVMA